MSVFNQLFRRRQEVSTIPLADRLCVFCGALIARNRKKTNCASCKSRARIRSLVPLLRLAIVPRFMTGAARDKPLLAFSAATAERRILAPHFASLTSVSLFGRYAKDHHVGIDARCLEGFADNAYAGQYSCLLFDYFLEHDRALAEAFRVIAPGGVFFTHIAQTRLAEGATPPSLISVIEPRAGYYEYIPAGKNMMNVRVGASLFLRGMEQAGFEARRWRVHDPSGIVCDWFVGWK